MSDSPSGERRVASEAPLSVPPEAAGQRGGASHPPASGEAPLTSRAIRSARISSPYVPRAHASPHPGRSSAREALERARRREQFMRVDRTGTAHPVGRLASRMMRQRPGEFRLLPGPREIVVMRHAGRPGTEPPAPELWLAGEIVSCVALWDLVGMMGSGGWTGELVVDDGQVRRSLFLNDGIVIGATSSAPRESLPQILYRYGALNENQVAQVELALTPWLRFGETAVEMGLIGYHDLYRLVGAQVGEIFYAMMEVAAGTFYFASGYESAPLAYRLNLTVSELLLEGARRLDEIKYIRLRVPSGLHVPRPTGMRARVSAAALDVLAQIDGARSVDDVGRALGRGEFEVNRALAELVQAGMAELDRPRGQGVESAVVAFNEAMKTILATVDTYTAMQVDVREALASYASTGGVYDALFARAGGPDGTLRSEEVAAMVQESSRARGRASDAEDIVRTWLVEYADFALSVTRPLLTDHPDPAAVAALGRAEVLLRALRETRPQLAE